MFALWIILAIGDFVLGFTKLFTLNLVVSSVFGVLNMSIILSLLISAIEAKKAARKAKAESLSSK